MSAASWDQTPGGIMRRGTAVAVEGPFDARMRELADPGRAALKVLFDEAHERSVNPDLPGGRAVQEELAERGWTGQFVNVTSTIPPELAPLYAQQAVATARQGAYGPGGADEFVTEMYADAQARAHAAQIRMDAKMGPLGRTVAG